jgi:CheY-like chemotaxis protein
MRTHNIPLDGLDGGVCRILIVDCDVPQPLIDALNETGRYEAITADNGFDAGVLAQRFRPHVIVLDAARGRQEASTMCRNIKAYAELQGAKVLAATEDPDASIQRQLLAQGFDECLSKPYSLRQLIQAVEDVSNLVR